MDGGGEVCVLDIVARLLSTIFANIEYKHQFPLANDCYESLWDLIYNDVICLVV